MDGGVTCQTSVALRFLSVFTQNGQIQLGTRGLSIGIANGNSCEDFHVVLGGLHWADLENKGGESSVVSAIVEGVTISTNFLMGLLNQGIPRNECVVPVVANTGLSMHFGVTVLLNDSFPTYIPLSKQLDLLDQYENQAASAYLTKIITHCRSMCESTNRRRPLNDPIKELTLNPNKYFVKVLSPAIFERGFGLFSLTENVWDVQPGLNHMIRCLNALYNSDAHDVVEYPLSIRTPDEGTPDEVVKYYELVYRDLCALGFVVGVPDRINDSAVYNLFNVELQRCVGLVHKCGVIHVDLYASNIMYKYVEGVMTIKIIDWDAAHCLDEGSYCRKVELALGRRLGEGNVRFGIEHDLMYLSVYDASRTSENEDLWKNLASGVKSDIDSAFATLLDSVLRNGGNK